MKDEARRIKRELAEQKKQKDKVAITEKEDDGKFFLHLVLFLESEFFGSDYMDVSGVVFT